MGDVLSNQAPDLVYLDGASPSMYGIKRMQLCVKLLKIRSYRMRAIGLLGSPDAPLEQGYLSYK